MRIEFSSEKRQVFCNAVIMLAANDPPPTFHLAPEKVANCELPGSENPFGTAIYVPYKGFYKTPPCFRHYSLATLPGPCPSLTQSSGSLIQTGWGFSPRLNYSQMDEYCVTFTKVGLNQVQCSLMRMLSWTNQSVEEAVARIWTYSTLQTFGRIFIVGLYVASLYRNEIIE